MLYHQKGAGSIIAINILYTIDVESQYLELFQVSIDSLIRNISSNTRLNIFVVVNKRGFVKTEGFDSHISIHEILYTPPLAKEKALHKNGYLSSMMIYARLYLENYLPEEILRIIYLDCDTLIVNDISLLWDENLEEKIIGAVPDHSYSKIISNYFNDGVLLIDLQKWRGCKITERLHQIINEYGPLEYHDQDALNLVFHDGNYKELSAKFNFSIFIVLSEHIFYDKNLINKKIKPIIVHYNGKIKPNDAAYKGPYNTYLGQSVSATSHFSKRMYNTYIWNKSILPANISWLLKALLYHLPLRFLAKIVYRMLLKWCLLRPITLISCFPYILKELMKYFVYKRTDFLFVHSKIKQKDFM